MSFASDKHRVLFIHTHRTGGTSVRKAMKLADPAVRMIGLGHQTLAEVRALDETAAGYYSFAAVREPREWLHSLYRYVGWALADHRDYHLVRGMEFGEFVRWLVDVGLKRDTTYRRQADFAAGVDYLYPYEKMTEAVPRVFQTCGLPVVPLPHELQSPKGIYYWAPEFTQYVERHFAEDVAVHRKAMEAWK